MLKKSIDINNKERGTVETMKFTEGAKSVISPDRVVVVATSDGKGTPHLAAAKGISLVDTERVAFENWFCMQTLENIAKNPKVAISLLDPDGESGVQLIGTVDGDVVTEILNGFAPSEEKRPGSFPQAKHRLQIRVEKALKLSTGPHSDD
jgi:predicted pyridoxine 5'-phosphate oxidase superfamily flavin-nucleotide-binding protein